MCEAGFRGIAPFWSRTVTSLRAGLHPWNPDFAGGNQFCFGGDGKQLIGLAVEVEPFVAGEVEIIGLEESTLGCNDKRIFGARQDLEEIFRFDVDDCTGCFDSVCDGCSSSRRRQRPWGIPP